MNHPTYEQQWQKITEAYLNNELNILNPRFCFCGNLCDNNNDWFRDCCYIHYDSHGYKGDDFVRMETALFDEVSKVYEGDPMWEECLFNGMVAALEVLRQIHLKKGDETAQPITLQKRTLCAAQ